MIMGSEGDPKTNLMGPYKLFFAQFMFFYKLSQVSSSTSKPKTFPFLFYIDKSIKLCNKLSYKSLRVV